MEQGSCANALILAHLDKVAITARLLVQKLPPSIEWRELASVGTLAMIEAEPRYDAQQGEFWTFVYRRVRGAMLDFLRDNYSSVPSETVPTPAARLREPYIKIDMERAIARLTCQQRRVVDGLREGRLGREIAEKIGVSEARVSQIRKGLGAALFPKAGYMPSPARGRSSAACRTKLQL